VLDDKISLGGRNAYEASNRDDHRPVPLHGQAEWQDLTRRGRRLSAARFRLIEE